MNIQTKTAPLGIIDSLSAGFNTVAQKPILFLIPFLLDIFLWFGPILSITPLVPDLTPSLGTLAGGTTDNSAAIFERNMNEILGSYNLFSTLSTWPLGTPSLLAGNETDPNPLNTPRTILVDSLTELTVYFLGLILLGLLLGSLYLGLIARSAKGNEIHLGAWMSKTWLYWMRTIAFIITLASSAFLLSVPFFLMVEISAMLLPALASLILLTGIVMTMWILFHLFFTIHGILLDDLGIRQAMRKSVTLVRKYRLSSVGLLIVSVIIGLGMTILWNMPPSSSWLRLIAISGNAFVNTGLVAATFIFYRERSTTPN